jgi:hypothetical protein
VSVQVFRDNIISHHEDIEEPEENILTCLISTLVFPVFPRLIIASILVRPSDIFLGYIIGEVISKRK